jgi:hypothetical protein
MSHLLTWNLLSTKDSYKRFSSLQSLKELLIDIMNNWEYSSLNIQIEEDNEVVVYESIFYQYNSYEDFLNKNLILFNYLKPETYIIDNKLIVKELYPLAGLKTHNCNISDHISRKNSHSILNGNPQEQFKWREYTSTLNFINDLISISEILKGASIESRNKILKSFISFLNLKLLPSNVYVPIPFGTDCLNSSSHCEEGIVLSITEEYALCLSTKEKVPFHILIEVAEKSENIKNLRQMKFLEQMSSLNLKSKEPMESYSQEIDRESLFTDYMIHHKSSDVLSSINSTPPSNIQTRSSGSLFSFFTCCSTSRDNISNSQEEEKIKTDDFSIGLFGTSTFKEVSKNLLEKSKFQIPNRKIISLIVKGGEDMRQDQFISQIMEIFLSIFDKENLDIFLKPLSIITTGRGGIIETLTNTISLQKIKSVDFEQILKVTENGSSRANNEFSYLSYFTFYGRNNNLSNSTQNSINSNLKNYFIYKFGRDTDKYKKAVHNFLKSFVGYSLLCYLFEVKDRNNGNILLDDEGHMIHIDFGFLLSSSPGNMNFEKAPFKFTTEFLELLDGQDSELFQEFQNLFFKAYKALRKNSSMILSFVDIYIMSNSDLPCFYDAEFISDNMKKKFMLECCDNNLRKEDDLLKDYTNSLITWALDNWRTKMYDNFQKYCVGVN